MRAWGAVASWPKAEGENKRERRVSYREGLLLAGPARGAAFVGQRGGRAWGVAGAGGQADPDG